MGIAGFVSLGLTLPFALYQIWKFVKPGLTSVERRYALRLLPVTLVRAMLFVVHRVSNHLALPAQYRSSALHRDVTGGFLLRVIMNICLPLSFIFELPIVVVFLTRIGVMTPR